jgi:hypothetical protein
MSGDDYWIAENRGVLPRVFIPRHFERLRDGNETLARMAAPTFDPAEIAFVDADLPSLPREMAGDVRIVEERSTRVEVRCELPAPALVVLADHWDPGWKATLDGRPVPVLRVDHAIRGVVAPAGTSTLVFIYSPDSLRAGIWTAAFAGLTWVFWMGQILRRSHHRVRFDRAAKSSPRRAPDPNSD